MEGLRGGPCRPQSDEAEREENEHTLSVFVSSFHFVSNTKFIFKHHTDGLRGRARPDSCLGPGCLERPAHPQQLPREEALAQGLSQSVRQAQGRSTRPAPAGHTSSRDTQWALAGRGGGGQELN